MAHTDVQKRNINDCEIRSISFTDNTVHLRLLDPVEVDYFTMVFHGLRYIIFETDHYQNVLSSFALFDSWEDLKNDEAALKWLEKVSPSILESNLDGAKIAYFQPTTGGETLVVFEELEYDG